MRKILFLAAVFINLVFANDFYEKALKFEQNGDYKNAMKYYKLAAQKNQKNQNSTNLADKNSPNNKLVIYKLSSEKGLVVDENLTKFAHDNKENASKKSLETSDISTKQSAQVQEETQDDRYFGVKSYEPIYLAWAYDFNGKKDRDLKELKFQISFEKPLFTDLIGLDETLSFAYTQTSWWQIYEESAPFRTTNYRPELFLTIPTELGAMQYTRVGFMHQSNGEGAQDSRSWNRAYLQTNFKFGNFELTPRVWYAFAFDSTNEDIHNYLGYGDLRASYKYGNQKFSAIWRNNLHFDSSNRGAFGLDWSFPLFNSGLFGYVQYFSGYGESLADYDKSVDKIAVGVAFSR
ncbi:phospholipase A [Campylobacter geochelonis]|uniref:phospholipase A n=1 Tax=Campylobacter geochelonis TaxID=1780362 RepID=UPI0007708225|nr:phospholipase A [Campylobacter geochelonis]CZE45915.1 phospholipase A [Campylobacter geochelonis]CZE49805.1 phospholipase A [Campylobacter geochelonis]